jgi:ribosomal protein L17
VKTIVRAAIVSLILTATPLFAQDDGGYGEIVVTAQRRQQQAPAVVECLGFTRRGYAQARSAGDAA